MTFHQPRRRLWLRAGLALASAPLLPAARACEFPTTHFTLVHPWTRATRPGDTTAVVSMVFRDVGTPDRLIAVRTPVAAGAELAGPGAGTALDLPIPAGEVTELAEAGLHLRLTGLVLPLQMARSYPLTLVFAEAGELRALLNVDYARFT